MMYNQEESTLYIVQSNKQDLYYKTQLILPNDDYLIQRIAINSKELVHTNNCQHASKHRRESVHEPSPEDSALISKGRMKFRLQEEDSSPC